MEHCKELHPYPQRIMIHQKGHKDAQKIKLKQKPKVGPGTKKRRASIVLKKRKNNEKKRKKGKK